MGIKGPDNASSLQAGGQVTAPLFKGRVITEFANQTSHMYQSSFDVAMARRVDRQFIEYTRNAAPFQQLSSDRAKQVDSSTYTIKVGFPLLVAVGQIAVQASFYGVYKDLRDKMRYLVWCIF